MGRTKVAAILAASLLALLAAAHVSAQEPTLSIGSATIAPGDSGSVNLDAVGMAAPGLGAWSVDVSFDPAILGAVDCTPQNGSVCNAAYADDTVRVTGAAATGLDGDSTLASIEFRCSTEGTSTLTLETLVFADATPGDPQPIEAATTTGTVTCQEGGAPTATTTETPQATAQPTAEPTRTPQMTVAGTGPGDIDSGSLSVIIAGLIGAGIAWLVVAGAVTGWKTLPVIGRPRSSLPEDDETPPWLRMARRR